MTTTNSPFIPAPDPALSERTEKGGYRWLLTVQERSHITSILNCEESDVALSGNVMTRDRQSCKNCGKPSGLDDLVQDAKRLEIHSQSFMLDVLKHGPKNNSPAHKLSCSRCGTSFDGEWEWFFDGPPNWYR